MNSIQAAYINALLADASYVNVSNGVNSADMRTRLTPTQSAYLAANFEVLDSVETSQPLGLGFDAVVWRGKANTEFAGKAYVSMRGTQGVQDIADDVSLALTGIPHQQIADMVNWWLRATASSSNTNVAQIKLKLPNTPLDTITFELAAPATGTGKLTGANAVSAIESVNGHSLGGYLATAFTRLFGANVQSVNTFNSAGFNNLAASSIASAYNQITQLIGATALGPNSFEAVGALQTNFYGQNGTNFTTNSLADMRLPGFNQYGARTALYQEDGLGSDPIANHYMYKLTDYLALGTALEKLDPSMYMGRLNTIVKAGSNVMAGSYEGVLDGLLKALVAPNVAPLPVGDASDSAASRVSFHEALAALRQNPAFTSLQGKLVITPSDANKLRAAARNNFGAIVALQDLSPVAISAANPAADSVLNFFFGQARGADFAAWQADKTKPLPTNFTDTWIKDRADMLALVMQRNTNDLDGVLPGTTNLRYFDAASNTEILVGAGATNDQRVQYLFGGGGADTLDGKGFADRLYGGAGADTLNGLGGSDYLEGNAGADILNGGDGNDILVGGAGVDSYSFAGQWGKDRILDSDGLGALQIDGQTLASAKGLGQRNVWAAELKDASGAGTGVYAGLAIYDDASSSTGKSLIITKGADTSNSITIKNFDLAKAQSAQAQGYLGIQLGAGRRLALVQGASASVGAGAGGANVWSELDFDLARLAGKSSSLVEGAAKTFTVYLDQAARAGDSLSLALSGEAGKFKVLRNGALVDAGGAGISLLEGQTQAEFSLVQTGDLGAGVTADASFTVSASYVSAGGGGGHDANSYYNYSELFNDHKGNSPIWLSGAGRFAGKALFDSRQAAKKADCPRGVSIVRYQFKSKRIRRRSRNHCKFPGTVYAEPNDWVLKTQTQKVVHHA